MKTPVLAKSAFVLAVVPTLPSAQPLRDIVPTLFVRPLGILRAAMSLALTLITTSLFAQTPTPDDTITENYQGYDVVKSDVIVKLHQPIQTAVAALSAILDADNAHQIGRPSGPFLFHSHSKGAAELLTTLSGQSGIVYAEPHYVYHLFALPSDPYFSTLWALNNTVNPGADIHAVSAWDVSTGSRQNVVAVLDTGVDFTHPDLAANIWSAPAPFTISLSWGTLACPAGSHGYDALAHSCIPMDTDRHGTHVAGIIGAVGNNFIGVTGVNWTSSIMPLRIASAAKLGAVTIADAIDAIEFAIQVTNQFASSGTPVNVRALSNSWGGNPFSQALLDEINKANLQNMLFVAAAGNLGNNNDIYPLYPASYNAPNVIAVAATDSTDALASFSDYGPGTVHLGAPGVSIFSTLPNATYGYNSGTSMAAPYVSGTAALVLSACNLTTAGVKAAVLNNVDIDPALTGRTVTGGRLNANKAIRSCAAASPPPPPNGAAAFVAADTATLGNWKGRYGSDGYAVASDSLNFPVYASVSLPNAVPYLWQSSTIDVRALQKSASSTDRIASAWYNPTSFLFDINLKDGKSHQVALYLLDWDSLGRAERIDILDAVSGSILDSHTVSGFQYGKYLAWNLTGHVQARVTLASTGDAVVSGIFFDAAGSLLPPAANTAAFVNVDTATQGTWANKYGADGFAIPNGSTAYPAYAVNSTLGASLYTWAASTTDVRALQKSASSSDRIASTWYNSSWFLVDVNLQDGKSHQVALYLLDWDSLGRAERIDILDAVSGNVLDTRNVSSFQGGQYLVWNLVGHVQIRATLTGSGNAVISGIFFGGASQSGSGITVTVSPASPTLFAGQSQTFAATVTGTSNSAVTWSLSAGAPGSIFSSGLYVAPTTISTEQSLAVIATSGADHVTAGTASVILQVPTGGTAAFVHTDLTTQGSWKGVYGSAGYNVIQDTVAYPPYVTVSPSGPSSWIWAGSTADVRALQKAASSTDRIAACWYTNASSSFTVDLIFSDIVTHQLALYFVDWDSLGRSLQVAVFDGNNNVLDVRTVSNFANGQYLVWSLSGHVRVRITDLGGGNPVLSGLFFQ